MENLSDREQFERGASESLKWTPAQRNGKLLKWGIRQALTIALVYWLWDKPWIKYVLWFWLPLAAINLLGILLFNRWVGQKFKKPKQEGPGGPAE